MYVIASHRNELCGGSGLSVAHVSGKRAAYGTVGQVKKESNIKKGQCKEMPHNKYYYKKARIKKCRIKKGFYKKTLIKNYYKKQSYNKNY